MIEKKAKSPLWRKLAVLTTLFAIIPAGVIALSLLDANKRMVKEVSRAVRLSAVNEVRLELDVSISATRRDLGEVALALSDPSLDRAMRIPLARTLVGGSPLLDQVAIFDASGKWIDTIREEGASDTGNPGALPKTLTDEIEQRGGILSTEDNTRVRLIAPMRPSPDKLTGFVTAEVDLSFLKPRLEGLVAERFGGDPEALLILDRDGVVRGHATSARLGSALEDSGMTAWLMPMVSVGSVAVSGEYEGEKAWMVTASPLEEAPWLVVARVTQDEAYAPLVKMRLLVLGALLLVVLLSCVAALLFARRLTRPVADLVRHCVELAQRNFGARVEIKTKDEFSILGETLNTAARDLADSEEEIRRQERIRQDLGRYMPREIVEKITAREDQEALHEQRAEVTVLFADIVDFTPLCESRSPEVVVTILNEFFTIATEIIFRHGGVVDKFVGDCVMAFWGAPDPMEDHAERALLAAEDLISWLEIGNAGWRERFEVEIDIAIGVHSGTTLVGNVGSESRVVYTVVGEVANLAARLESIARPGQILTSGTTASMAGDVFDIVGVGKKSFPGMEDEVELFEVRL